MATRKGIRIVRRTLVMIATACGVLCFSLTVRAANPDAKDMPMEADIKVQLAWATEQLGE
jgi:hypothetical protein